MHSFEELQASIPLIEEKLKYNFHNKELLLLALTHRSFFNENRTLVKGTNERLEFLGDCVLGLVVSEYLYEQLPKEEEGRLSHLRSSLVEAGHCSLFLHQIGMSSYILLGKGERMNDGRGRESIMADLFEALLGAIYLDGGLEQARSFFLQHFAQEILKSVKTPSRNWKAELQDYSQRKYQTPPLYRIVGETGPDHSKEFEVVVSVGDQDRGMGKGASKKQAEQLAAKEALERLEVEL